MSRSSALFLCLLAAAPASIGAAQGAAPTGSAPPASAPRVIVVVRGDPTPTVLAAADELTSALVATNELTLPSDPAVRRALIGRAAEGTDGLDDLRAARRQLGWEAARDTELLARLGAFTQAAAVVVVRDGTPPSAEVFDVARREFYEGVTTLDAPTYERATRFVRARARAANARATAEGAAATATPVATPPPVTATVAGATSAATSAPAATSPTTTTTTAPAATTPTTTASGTASAAPSVAVPVSPTDTSTARASTTHTVPPSTALEAVQDDGRATETTAAPRERGARAFFRKSWPWLVAGVALATTITVFAVLQHHANEASNPVIHVRPGGM